MQTLHCCSLTEGYFGPPVMLPKVLTINTKIRTHAPKLAEAGKHKVNLCNPPSTLLSPLQMLLLSLNLTHPRLNIYSAIHTILGEILRLMHFVRRPICLLFDMLAVICWPSFQTFCLVYHNELHITICNWMCLRRLAINTQ